MEGLEDFDNQPDNAAWGKKLAALLAFGTRELAEKVFIDPPEGVVVEAGGDLRYLLQVFQV